MMQPRSVKAGPERKVDDMSIHKMVATMVLVAGSLFFGGAASAMNNVSYPTWDGMSWNDFNNSCKALGGTVTYTPVDGNGIWTCTIPGFGKLVCDENVGRTTNCRRE